MKEIKCERGKPGRERRISTRVYHLSDKFKIMISIMILFKDIKLIGQSDSYHVLQVLAIGMEAGKRGI